MNKLYGVVILNYKCAEDAVLAAESVIRHAKEDNYFICIVDGGSNSEKDINILKSVNLPNVEILFLDINGGYAKGNNEGIKYIKEKYHVEYIVIMNPDVVIVEDNTIEDVIEFVKKNDAVGGQPLVKTGTSNLPANMQVNIRNVCRKFDCLVLSGFIFNRIFRKRYNKYIYKDFMPYDEMVRYYTPSGAFFVINSLYFSEVGYFDDRTFLYSEELILGYKNYINQRNMILIPYHTVEHECGKSIGANAKHPSKFSHMEMNKSFDLYMKEYLKLNIVFRKAILHLRDIDFIIKKLLWRFR